MDSITECKETINAMTQDTALPETKDTNADASTAPIAVGDMKDDTHGSAKGDENTPDDNDNDELGEGLPLTDGKGNALSSPPALIPLSDEDKAIIKTMEAIIAPKTKAKVKAKAKAVVTEQPVIKKKDPKPKLITLLPNQTLQIKLPDVDRSCKIEFI